MAEVATRVALLARPGNACDRLQTALRDAGADVVLVADPTFANADDVRAAGVQAILVALEPSIEMSQSRKWRSGSPRISFKGSYGQGY